MKSPEISASMVPYSAAKEAGVQLRQLQKSAAARQVAGRREPRKRDLMGKHVEKPVENGGKPWKNHGKIMENSWKLMTTMQNYRKLRKTMEQLKKISW